MRTLSSRHRLAIGTVTVVLTLAACGSDSDGTATPAGTAAADATSAAPADSVVDTTAQAPTDGETVEAAAVPAALQFSAPLVGGGEFDGAAVADKPTVFWFWAPT